MLTHQMPKSPQVTPWTHSKWAPFRCLSSSLCLWERVQALCEGYSLLYLQSHYFSQYLEARGRRWGSYAHLWTKPQHRWTPSLGAGSHFPVYCFPEEYHGLRRTDSLPVMSVCFCRECTFLQAWISMISTIVLCRCWVTSLWLQLWWLPCFHCSWTVTFSSSDLLTSAVLQPLCGKTEHKVHFLFAP